ncbi:MAG: sodium:calcium antiporter [Thermoplasmata archaeon]|nr:sodium:calcium antiporter [Thermoplasmata archaeon]
MVLDLITSILLVFFSSLLFVNAVEYVGFKLNLSKSFIGTIISPLFTSFPELVIFLVAVFEIGSYSGSQEAIGTIFGETFMSSSISYTLVFFSILVGSVTIKNFKKTIRVEKTLSIPYIFISILFPFTLLPYFIHITYIPIAIIFLLAYIIYFYIIYKNNEAEMFEETEKPYFAKFIGNKLGTALQIFISALLIYLGSRFLLNSILSISMNLHLSILAISIVLIPSATAIPETITAMIWAYREKYTLSIGSLVGEKILYSTIYPGIALLLVPWNLDIYVFLSVLVTTLVSVVYSIIIMKGKFSTYYLLLGFIFFIIYAMMI